MPVPCPEGVSHHNLEQRLWKGIKDASNWWIITVEQTVEGLQGLQRQSEELIDDWLLAWDKITVMQLDGEGEQTDPDAVAQRKQPDAWAMHCLLILEFT
jgi:hypothetical protein